MSKSRSIPPPLKPQSLDALLRAQGFALPSPQLEQLALYLGLLEKWNRVMNLVGPGSWADIVNNLVLDSCYLAQYLPSAQLPADPLCWDFGSGAGIPGIPLRILWQTGSYSLVEVREKRVLFMRTALAQLNLSRTQVVQARIEDFMEQARPADILISRAFMPWEKLLAAMQGRLAPGGKVLIMALEPSPVLPPELAGQWRVLDEFKYSLPASVANRQRYFWLLSS